MNTVVILNGGTSNPSSTKMLADTIAGALQAQASKRGDSIAIESIDIREYGNDLATFFATGMPTPALQEAREKISNAQGLIAATPVFSASYSGLFKMFIDALDTDSLNDMPVLIAATAGTPRHSLMLEYAMRPLFSYLRAIVMPTAVFAAVEEFGQDSELQARVNRAATELASYVLAQTTGSAQVVGGGTALAGFGPDFTQPQTPQRTRHSGNGLKDGADFAALLQKHRGDGNSSQA